MAAPLEQDDEEILKDDYYSLLNVSKEATKDEISYAFKRLCLTFHPDKHSDPEQKKKAEVIFNRLKTAHEILTDDTKRTLYDLYGEKGLETDFQDGMEIVSRTKTPAEIKAEYEFLMQQEQERKLQRRTNPKSVVVFGVNATDIFDPDYRLYEEYDDEQSYIRVPDVKQGVMSISQSVECPMTNQNTMIFGWDMLCENGRGTGVFTATWRRLMSNRGVFETSVALGGKTSLSCNYDCPVYGRIHGTISGSVIDKAGGLDFALGPGVSYQIGNNCKWTFKYNILDPSSVRNMLVYQTEEQQIVLKISLSLYNSFILASYTRNFKDWEMKLSCSAKVAQNGSTFEYGVEKKVSEFSTVAAKMSLSTQHGVIVNLTLHRGQHTMVMPVSLSGEIIPSAVVYGTVVPLIVYFAAKKLIIDPYVSKEKEKDLERRKEQEEEKILEKRQEAQAYMDLMTETVHCRREAEERRNGLVIVKAMYGILSCDHQSDLLAGECVDVTVPLQALVTDSKLIIVEGNTKSSLPGFYDPCPGKDKQLYIKYKFRNKLHHVTLDETKIIRLPQQRHEIPTIPLSEDQENYGRGDNR